MLDLNDLVIAMKKASLDVLNTTQPSDFCYGKVVSVSPLKISIEQKLTLGTAQLVLTRNVTDYKIKVSLDWETEKTGKHSHYYSGSGGYSCSGNTNSVDDHVHKIVGNKDEETEKELTIHNALKLNEEVVLLKQKGGQKYLVLDRVMKA